MVECEIGEVLYSYYLKEHDTDKGRYQMITRECQSLFTIVPTIVVGKIDFSLSEESLYGGCVGLEACPIIGRLKVRIFMFNFLYVD